MHHESAATRPGRFPRLVAVAVALIAIGVAVGVPGRALATVEDTPTDHGAATASQGASLSGVASAAGPIDPAADLRVTLHGTGNTAAAGLSVTTSSASGYRFSFEDVVPGHYELRFAYGGAVALTAFGTFPRASGSIAPLSSAPDAEYDLVAGQTKTVALVAPTMPCLIGTVTGRTADGVVHLLDNARISAYATGSPDKTNEARTDESDGSFILCLPRGRYEVRITPAMTGYAGAPLPAESGPAFAKMWLGGVALRDQSTSVELTSDVGRDLGSIESPPAATISGVLHTDPDAGSGTYPKVSVSELDPDSGNWEEVDWANVPTWSAAPYTIGQLLPGSYKISWSTTGKPLPYWPTYAPSTRDIDDGAVFAVTAEHPATDVDITPIRRIRSSDRIAGQDRFATAAAVADAFPSSSDDADGADVVFVASGANFPDALSAGPAAAALGAPLLLVQPDSVPTSTAEEIARLRPGRIVVVGGTASVSEGVANTLTSQTGAPVTRLAGADRYATSRAVMRAVFVDTASPLYAGPADEVYVASGSRFPDALSGGAAASHFGDPLLIVDGGAAHADPASIALVHGLQSVVGVGGPGALNPDVLAELNDSWDAFAGADRYDTSEQVNTDALSTSDTALLAVGTNFPDALSGVPLAGLLDAPLFITPGTCVPSATVDALNQMDVVDVILLGGSSVLSSSVASLTRCS